MRANWVLCVLALGLLTAASAQAEEYDWVQTSGTGLLAKIPFPATLDVSHAAYVRGSLAFSFQNPYMGSPCDEMAPCTISGDFDDFISLTNGGPEDGELDMNLTFNRDGTLSGSIYEYGINQDLNASGAEFSWSAVVSSDFLEECGACTTNGYWLLSGASSPIPEPPAIALLGIGMAGLAVRLRGRFAHPQ